MSLGGAGLRRTGPAPQPLSFSIPGLWSANAPEPGMSFWKQCRGDKAGGPIVALWFFLGRLLPAALCAPAPRARICPSTSHASAVSQASCACPDPELPRAGSGSRAPITVAFSTRLPCLEWPPLRLHANPCALQPDAPLWFVQPFAHSGVIPSSSVCLCPCNTCRACPPAEAVLE